MSDPLRVVPPMSHNAGVRVIAGALRGRKLGTPGGLETRPTSDRVREATFNALGSLGVIESQRVVDLFAGSGAMGIESLSRGAASCTFVERDRQARDVIHENLRNLALIGRADVVANDVQVYLKGAPTFGLALVDPPYQFDAWGELLGVLDAEVAVLESNRVIEMPSGWSTVRERHYGGTVVLISRRSSGQARGVHPRRGL